MSYTRTTIVAVHYLAERLDMIVHIPNKSETAETEEPEANSGVGGIWNSLIARS
ncbi:hypothetical protein J6590_037807 [Homalodisca vitripennis]|nr:hypothetical protein J6590_037807 [Homalodisca vitripennis]